MSLVSPRPSLKNNNSLFSSATTDLEGDDNHTPNDTEATLSSLLGAFTNARGNSMERGATEYSQSGLPTPYPHAFTDARSEDSPADTASATRYTSQPEVRPSTHTTTSEYGAHPASARSGSVSEHITRGGMAQPTSPSLPLQDSRPNHHNPQIKSDQDVPIDPSIAASSPAYPPQHGQYSPYPPQEQMQHGYPSHPGGAMYAQPRPDWAGYGGHPQHGGMPGYAVTGAQTPTSAAPAGARPGQVGSSNSDQDSTSATAERRAWNHPQNRRPSYISIPITQGNSTRGEQDHPIAFAW